MKPLLLAAALLFAAVAPADACTATGGACQRGAEDRPAKEQRRAPRIIFGETEAVEFRFRSLAPIRRSNAATRQAYFGSGEDYSTALAGLRKQLRAMETRSRLEGLQLTPAQEAAKSNMPPALARALALSKRAREKAAD